MTEDARARTLGAQRDLAASRVKEWRTAGDRIVVLVGGRSPRAFAADRVRDAFASPVFDRSVAVSQLFADEVLAINVGVDRPMGLDETAPAGASMNNALHGLRATLAWAREVVTALVLERTMASTPRLRVVVLAGEPIAAPIIHVINEAREGAPGKWAAPSAPLRGLSIGDRLYVLARTSHLLAHPSKEA